MQLTDTRDIAADPATVWAAILNPEVLKACVPGCESMTGSPETGFEAAVVQKVGPVKARFAGVVQLLDMIEPIEGGTRLTYVVEANVGGKLAQLGSRIIDGFAKKMADEFFARFQEAVEHPAGEVEEETVGADGAEPEKKKGWFRRLIG